MKPKSKIDLLLKITITITLILLLFFVIQDYALDSANSDINNYNNNLDYKPRLKDRIDLKNVYFNFSNMYYDYCNSSQGSSMYPCYAQIFIEPRDIQIGDIVLIKLPDKNETEPLMHRIVEINEDEKGVYYITKGDRNKERDETKWRKEDIMYVVVAEFK